MVRLNELFEIRKSKGLELNALEQTDTKHGVAFVSRTASNNGISAYVKADGFELYEPGTISVALGGTVMEAFVQERSYVTSYHIASLKEKVEMTLEQKQFYCLCLRANKYRYNYGRQANKTLCDILVPDISEIPKWVSEECELLKQYKDLDVKSSWNEKYGEGNCKVELSLDTSDWKEYKLTDLFNIRGTKNTKLDRLSSGSYPYITTKSSNNGVYGFCDVCTESGNVLVVESAVAGYCSYQEQNFSCSEHIELLEPKFTCNVYIGEFITAVINMDNYRYNYGRKYNKERLNQTIIKLPSKLNSQNQYEPDYEFMENFIKSLPYSALCGGGQS